MKKEKYILLVIFTMMTVLSSCFKKDEAISPFQASGNTISIAQSIYTNQIYFAFSSDSIIKINANEDWDLCFESAPSGWHIRVNSANYLGIYRTASNDFSQVQFTLNNKSWKYDKSSGNIDSTAVGTWVNMQVSPSVYTNQVFLIGQYDGITYNASKKLQFTMVNDTSYRFSYADLNGNNPKDVLIRKDTSCNYTYYSISTQKQVTIEPKRTDWDMVFTQYSTTLYSNGAPVDYFVRGVLINPYKVQVAADSTRVYENIGISNLSEFNFQTNWDAIGYNWKSVVVNALANTAKYTVRDNYFYVVRDTKGVYYKLKFLSFFNTKGDPGYPAFEFIKL